VDDHLLFLISKSIGENNRNLKKLDINLCIYLYLFKLIIAKEFCYSIRDKGFKSFSKALE